MQPAIFSCRIGPKDKEGADNTRVPALDSGMESRLSVSVDDIRVSAQCHQPLHRRHVPTAGGVVQRWRREAVWRVHLDRPRRRARKFIEGREVSMGRGCVQRRALWRSDPLGHPTDARRAGVSGHGNIPRDLSSSAHPTRIGATPRTSFRAIIISRVRARNDLIC